MLLLGVGKLEEELFVLHSSVERRKRESYSQDILPPIPANPEVRSFAHSCCVLIHILQRIMKAGCQAWQGSAFHLHHADTTS